MGMTSCPVDVWICTLTEMADHPPSLGPVRVCHDDDKPLRPVLAVHACSRCPHGRKCRPDALPFLFSGVAILRQEARSCAWPGGSWIVHWRNRLSHRIIKASQWFVPRLWLVSEDHFFHYSASAGFLMRGHQSSTTTKEDQLLLASGFQTSGLRLSGPVAFLHVSGHVYSTLLHPVICSITWHQQHASLVSACDTQWRVDFRANHTGNTFRQGKCS